MDAQQFVAEFGHIAHAPGGLANLRRMIYQLAVTGSLTPRGESAEDAGLLLSRIGEERQRLIRAKKYKRMLQLESETVRSPPGIVLPTTWRWTRLLDIGEINPRNDAPDAQLAAFVPMSGVPQLHRAAIVAETKRWGDIKKGYTHFANGDVVLAKITPCFENGKAAAVEGLPGDAGIGAGTTELQVFRPIHAGVLPTYVYLFLRSPLFTVEGERNMTGTAGQKRVPTDYFATRAFPLPPFEEQSRIVAKVDELMALCDQLEQQQQDRRKLQNALRRATLQALASAQSPHELQTSWQRVQANFGRLFSEPTDMTDLDQAIKHLALNGRLTARRSGEQVSDHLISIADASVDASSAEGDWRIPSHWIWARCAWLGEARLGKMLDASKNKGELRPYLRNINVRWHRLDLSDVLRMRVEEHELQRVSVRRGDLVICEGGEPGRAAIWNFDEEFVIQKALHRFRCGPDVLPEYLLFCLEHDYFSGRLARYYTGATIKHLTGKALADYSIPLPPIAEQHRILEAAGAMSSVVATLRDQSLAARRCGELYAAAAVSALTGITIEQDEDTAVRAPQTELVAPLRLAVAPDVKAQAPLATILARHEGEMAARDLWQRFGGEIDAFYAQLKTEVAHGWIAEPEPAQVREKPTAEAAKA
ncbi:restriction endonuclease subunit S [Hydrogenophaga borbori]|uniref:restriction endonuclease subunit S n=1 Tax=Hydrogenophaga borbori TaxID=2294117 RepID=UPI00301D4CEF